MSLLFSPLVIRSVTLPNRIAMSPMCQFCSVDGMPSEWHLVHLGSRAVGGAGLVIAEATAVVPEGRISPQDAGLWSRAHGQAWARIAAFISAQGAVPGIQLAHAGRKGARTSPHTGVERGVSDADGGWAPVGPTAEPFSTVYRVPREMSAADISSVVEAFAEAARRAVDAGFKVVEVHAAHGYLLHQFLSPLCNNRTDEYGGDLQRRTRFPAEVVAAVRDSVGGHVPVFVRISASDWEERGITPDDAVEIASTLTAAGADLIDVSSGGIVPDARIVTGPGYQVPLAALVRQKAAVPTGAVGEISDPVHAERILTDGAADLVLLGRELLRDPYWPHRAAHVLDSGAGVPVQYTKAW